MNNKERPTIGFLIPNLLGEYFEIQWFSLNQSVIEYDVNLIVFSPFMFLTNAQNKNDYLKTFQYVSKKNVDGIIISSGSMRGYFDMQEVEAMVNSFSGIPIVSLSEDFKGFSSVLIDNKRGMEELIEHFVRDHGYRDIAFIKGPENNNEAAIRYAAYKKILHEYDIPLNEQLVYQGDFGFHSGERAVIAFLDERKVKIDTIIAAI